MSRTFRIASTAVTVVTLWAAFAPSAVRAARRQPDPAAAVRATLHKYDRLVGPHEDEKALPFYHATNTRDRAAAAVLARVDGALANLRHHATAKFGRDVAEAMLRSVGATTATDIDAAQITVTGDTASVLFPDSKSPSTMIRVSREWKLSVKAMLAGFGGRPREFRKAILKLASGADQVAEKIAAGQYPDAKSAAAAVIEVRNAAFANATTRP
jgi:hypothetical protein